MTVAILGAGVFGRVLALTLRAAGIEPVLFDRAPDGSKSAGFVAAGMLAPYCELERASESIFQLGLRSLELWPRLLRGLPVGMKREGSLLVALPQDAKELERFQSHFPRTPSATEMRCLDGDELSSFEPGLDRRCRSGIFFPLEGQVQPREFFAATNAAFEIRPPESLDEFDWVIDSRGLGAEVAGLRSVRGEVVLVQCDAEVFRRPVRVAHPRHPIYIVPQGANRYLIGATEIESASEEPVSVRSALELLSTAYALGPQLSEARILASWVGRRPAFADHEPRIVRAGRRISVNGLYRHGFLVSPALAETVCGIVQGSCA